MKTQIRCSNRQCGLITTLAKWREVKDKADSEMTHLHCPRCDNDSYHTAKPGEVEKPKSGAQLIALERLRQVKIEGWTATHDDTHDGHELALAATSYIAVVASPDELAGEKEESRPLHDWPWADEYWKPSNDAVRNLVKAGALIAAEIDRLQRAQKS